MRASVAAFMFTRSYHEHCYIASISLFSSQGLPFLLLLDLHLPRAWPFFLWSVSVYQKNCVDYSAFEPLKSLEAISLPYRQANPLPST